MTFHFLLLYTLWTVLLRLDAVVFLWHGPPRSTDIVSSLVHIGPAFLWNLIVDSRGNTWPPGYVLSCFGLFDLDHDRVIVIL